MAIEGPLRELALTDVLQLLDLSRKTGVLSLRREAAERGAEVFLDQGTVVGVWAPGRTRRLGELLLLAGKATQAQVDRALAEQARHPGRPLGAILVENERVPAQEVRRQLRFQIEELIFDVVRWTDGYFRFEEAPAHNPGGIPVRITTESLLMEAMRRMDEWATLSSTAPDPDLVPSLVEATSDAVLELQPLEWEVLAGIDGERTLQSIAREVGRGEFEVAKAVFGLVSAGVVEVGGRRRAAAGESAWSAPAPDGDVPERALREGRLDEAHRLLGFTMLRAGDLARAEEELRTYLRLTTGPDAARSRADRAVRALSELRELLSEEGE